MRFKTNLLTLYSAAKSTSETGPQGIPWKCYWGMEMHDFVEESVISNPKNLKNILWLFLVFKSNLFGSHHYIEIRLSLLVLGRLSPLIFYNFSLGCCCNNCLWDGDRQIKRPKNHSLWLATGLSIVVDI